ncbi:putative plastid-lipid-associated protein 4, chloroplastic [Apostasia shenzhenica]|uniref:Putative plastid-lipid-associated protein 4, chloroplastic n=1 Tax=Apostasia shenzhenica TaxID=1088818 RepID=A0A2I0B7H4_9ASPA|nr:putative plastid-lipid-associated protein 4, chloroplastic [Apostasia shenzhenica]
MASACSVPISSYPYPLKARANTDRLASPHSLPHFPYSRRQHRAGSLSAGNQARDLEYEVWKWRTRLSFFPFFIKRKSREVLKQELLEAIEPLDRGAAATPEDQERVDQIARELEAVNPVKEPLKSDFLNGKWELLYTTSRSILQPQRPKFLQPFGKIFQAINVDSLRAQNMETWPYFNQVTANLVPLNSRRVAVKFDTFKIGGLIPIKALGSGRGQLEITYLDEELRVSRGDKGNLFILKMVDPSYRVPF